MKRETVEDLICARRSPVLARRLVERLGAERRRNAGLEPENQVPSRGRVSYNLFQVAAELSFDALAHQGSDRVSTEFFRP